jgi:hypothetical protein
MKYTLAVAVLATSALAASNSTSNSTTNTTSTATSASSAAANPNNYINIGVLGGAVVGALALL